MELPVDNLKTYNRNANSEIDNYIDGVILMVIENS